MHGLDPLLRWLIHMIMIFSKLFLIFTLKYLNLVKNLANLADDPKIIGPCGVHGALFFQHKGPLVLGHFVNWPSAKGSGGQNYQGKVKSQGFVDYCSVQIEVTYLKCFFLKCV